MVKQIIMRITKIIFVAAATITIALSALVPFVSAAGSAHLYITPASGKLTKGDTLSMTVYEDSGSTSVNAVQANLSYSTAKLQFVSYSNSSSFPVETPPTPTNNGLLKFGRGAFTPVTGVKPVVTVHFKALAGSGTASITFASGSAVTASDGSGTNLSLTTTPASYTLAEPATSSTDTNTSSSSGSTSDSTSTSSSSSSSSTSTNDKSKTSSKAKKLIVSGVAVSNLGYNTATISWKTSVPASSEVDLSPTGQGGISSLSKKLVTSHSVNLSSSLLTPGMVYSYVVKSVDKSGHMASSTASSFRTKGVILTVTVVNKDGNPVEGAKVTVADLSGTTDNDGKVVLTDLPVGKYTAAVSFNDKVTKSSVETKSVFSDNREQSLKLTIDTGSNVPLAVIVPASGGTILALLVAGAFMIHKLAQQRSRMKEVKHHFPGLESAAAVTAPSTTVTPQAPELQLPSQPTVHPPTTQPEPPAASPPPPPDDSANSQIIHPTQDQDHNPQNQA